MTKELSLHCLPFFCISQFSIDVEVSPIQKFRIVKNKRKGKDDLVMKVCKFQKQIFLFSFPPKTNEIIF